MERRLNEITHDPKEEILDRLTEEFPESVSESTTDFLHLYTVM